MAQPSWKEALCYSEEKYVEHVVNGQRQKFYAVSVHLLFKLKTTATGVAKAVSALFADTKRDYKTIDSSVAKPKGDGSIERILQIDPVSMEMAKYRDTQRADAWATALDSISDKATQETIAEIILDSLRDVFKEDRPTPADFLKATPAPMFVQMAIGAAKANKDVLGPLMDKAGSLFKQLEGAVTYKLAEPVAPENEQELKPG